MNITGKTHIYGIFGYPVAHTASPAMHNAAFGHLGLDCAYLPFEVAPAKLGDAVKGLRAFGIRGVNVTVPHKETVIPFLDEVTREAKVIGAVNTVVNNGGRLTGHNTDGAGFLRSLKEECRFDLKGKRMVLVGAGGAGRAVAIQSLLSGLKQALIVDIDRKKCRVLTAYINKTVRPESAVFAAPGDRGLDEVVAACDIVVQATPCGMKSADPLPLDPSLLRKGQLVYDLVYNPPGTKLLKAAARKGCAVSNGLGMLLYQGCIAFEIWTGKKAPVAVMKKALARHVYGR
ncbi:MAG TPA: shikimate dehydrogenase [bacterium]|nr:shikimate dehydrogenase [bacterium]